MESRPGFPAHILHIWSCRKCSNRPDLKYYSEQRNGPFKCLEHAVNYISIPLQFQTLFRAYSLEQYLA